MDPGRDECNHGNVWGGGPGFWGRGNNREAYKNIVLIRARGGKGSLGLLDVDGDIIAPGPWPIMGLYSRSGSPLMASASHTRQIFEQEPAKTGV